MRFLFPLLRFQTRTPATKTRRINLWAKLSGNHWMDEMSTTAFLGRSVGWLCHLHAGAKKDCRILNSDKKRKWDKTRLSFEKRKERKETGKKSDVFSCSKKMEDDIISYLCRLRFAVRVSVYVQRYPILPPSLRLYPCPRPAFCRWFFPPEWKRSKYSTCAVYNTSAVESG